MTSASLPSVDLQYFEAVLLSVLELGPPREDRARMEEIHEGLKGVAGSEQG